ncbi:uncharacterized protein LOC106152083 [Lingula anatina]|uniref:Uncharacterized protein LOC106152083 n=1 Tax=Lingula anatina TaxID=7574 RepID=A0A1S3H4K4_LINAN|nr:uncharacterized protein LOC106152083 [Lingula anatina]|eukprot:XP_013381065.1 uncharacterized protein LOC106152083 [Lingula anatina]
MTEDSSCQTEFSRDKEAAADSDKEKAELILRLEKSQKHIELLEQRIALSQPKICAQDILNESSVQFWTGLPSVAVFNALFTYLEPKAKHLNITGRGTGKYQSAWKLDLIDEFFAVLVRLKVGLFVRDISQRLCISEGFFSKIFDVWIRFLRKELEAITRFPSVEEVRPHLPACFSDYPDTRVVIDCTEVYVQKPSSLKSQRELWSNYKHHNTYKGLVGISPDGTLSYVSDLYGGSASDKFITKDCGILELLQEGDNVMADRGFDISDLLVGKGVTLNIPPFINRNETQLSAQQVEETRRIASVRIHVERAIQRIKTFHILDGVVPLSLHSLISDIFKVCAYLTNFQTPIL